MQTENIMKKRANKLHDVLDTMGCTLSQSQCLEVVSDIEKNSESKVQNQPVSDSQSMAEQYLDRVVEAFMEQDYEKATQYTEKKYLVNFTERGFKKDVMNSREDLGAYMRREFLGTLEAESHPDEEGAFPDHVRYVWRGIFEKNEGLLIMGLYLKNGTYYTSNVSCK